MNMQNLKGKRVVITGGSQGLGLAMFESLAFRGASVTATRVVATGFEAIVAFCHSTYDSQCGHPDDSQ
jgi:gluconate 5-dehydrogenase